MAILNSKFDILRGWPDGSAIAEDFTISEIAAPNAGDNVFRAGHFVALGVEHDFTTANYTCASDASKLNSDGSVALGLVIEGKEDYSARMSNTVTALIAGGYVVRLHLEASQAGFQGKVDGGVDQFRAQSGQAGGNNVPTTMAAGIKVVVREGLVEPLYKDFHDTLNIVPIGTCLRYDSSDNTCDILVH